MTAALPALAELARSYGVATDFTDWRGRRVDVPEESIRAVLGAMGVEASDPAAALAAREEAPWRRILPACLVLVQGESRQVAVHVPHGDPVAVDLHLEDGGERRLAQLDRWVDPRHVAGELVGEATFEVPADLPLGYHTLRASAPGTGATGHLIVTPAWLGLPPAASKQRTWGFAVQLYSVRSQRSWGVGDLADLTDLAVWSGDLGADFLLVNPLHAAEPRAPMEPSPYLPTSRRFLNPLYIRVEQIPEYVDLPTPDRRRYATLSKRVHERLDGSEVIDRDTSWTAKRKALELVHRVPRRAGRELDYRSWCRRQGQPLQDFATWCAIAEEQGNDARAWPAELRDARSAAVADYAAAHAEEVGLHTWLQWVLDEQLAHVQSKALAAGMSLGTMHDLAVGVHPGGADAWRLRSTYASGISVGAPPDPFNQVGQNWSQPPWRPDVLEEQGYAPFRDLIAGALRHAGGVRVDHIIGLSRLWWVPEGRPASEGAYVRYDHEAMVGVLALEAQRAGAVVVGEDLGVVEPSARTYLRQRGILGTSILWFERDGEGRPLPAERWREYCLASVGTHDLPPTAGYLAGTHVRLREKLGLLTRPLQEEVAADEAERESWLDEVRSRGLLPAGADTRQTIEALNRYLTLTPARLLCVALTDAVGDRRTQNQPGTTDEYPNWRVPLSGPDERPMTLEDVLTSADARALVRVVDPQGP